MAYNIVDPATGNIVGALTWFNTAPAPAPTPTPAPTPAPTPGTFIIPWGPSLYTQWFDVAGAAVKTFQFTIGKQGANQQSVGISNTGGSNQFDFSVSRTPGSFTIDSSLGSANVRMASFGGILDFSQMKLQPGQTYFVNVRNTKASAPDQRFRLDMNQ